MIRRMLAVLRKEVPTVWPVKVRMRADLGKGMCGVCSLVTPRRGSPYFSIILHSGLNRLPLFVLRFVLAHEYAHAFAWTEAHPNVNDHDPEFGLAYSRCYRALTDGDE